jgi:hypothetical protein
MGHEERFPPTRPSAGYRFRKETIAGMRRNGRDAPIAVIGPPQMSALRASPGKGWPRRISKKL